MRVYKDFMFDAAHFLPTAPEGHPNRRMHGHSFRVVIWCEGKRNPETGFVRHFAELDAQVAVLREKLDHHVLNEIKGLENPTLETIVGWIWYNLKPTLPELSRIEIHRPSCHEGCVYDGPEDAK
jgi:6-pyruvoyltetrahydropterin/6-carboxytetrahydropterin synthase